MAKAIMIQGTMSNVGKSLLVAALCRIFKEDGYRVAPFKSQNMALNSFITKEGLEMGRAQVVQAEAAGIEPTCAMNPILLKPTNDTKSQVILQGEAIANMSAKEYYAQKRRFVPEIEKAYAQLDKEYDIIVLEGAGSPVEINLKEQDIVNMFMAKLVSAPVLLVGDIDRGGVFASLLGTMSLLDQSERDLVKGLVINKFRGDKTILAPGLSQLEQLVNKPVLGVIPYLTVEIEEEDSLSQRFTNRSNGKNGLLDIAVIRLPRISNFTDFSALERVPQISLRYVEHIEELKEPDMVLLPGTKNTMEDLLWLRQNGLEAAILKLAAKGKVIFGICGGYQMLGTVLSDPHHIEHGDKMKGMGLLPLTTVFAPTKTKTRVEGTFCALQGVLAPLSGKKIEGYEIHMGVTTVDEQEEECLPATMIGDIIRGQEEQSDGGNIGNVYGTYVHGIFDGDGIAEQLAAALCHWKGIDVTKWQQTHGENGLTWKEYKETQYDLLAQGVRENIDLAAIYDILFAK